MVKIGIICEYNPFHNGHLYHLEKIKEMFPESLVILVVTNNFTERGNMSILNKKEKTLVSLNHGIDLVVELPFKYGCQSADIFANGAIQILNKFKVDYLVFGSESNDVDNLINLANIQLNDKNYNNKVQEYLDLGNNYPTAMSKALKDISGYLIESPNDLLGLSYIKEIIKQKTSIKPISIQRSNDYHKSATDIRNNLNNDSIKEYVPNDVYKIIKNKKEYTYFNYLKYKILIDKEKINNYLDVDEGIENRIINYIDKSNSLDELINNIKTKRYTYNKISRMLIHILTSYTKNESKNKDLEYIRVLGFNSCGKKYLNEIKKDINIPLISNIKKDDEELLKLDIKVEKLYCLINDIDINSYKDKVIIKED